VTKAAKLRRERDNVNQQLKEVRDLLSKINNLAACEPQGDNKTHLDTLDEIQGLSYAAIQLLKE
jgi:uncharacterized coiled-coil DUF342 family protein